MTQRERLLAFLSGQPVDRVPIWLLFPYHPLPCYADVPRLPQYRAIWELAVEKAVFLDRRTFQAPLFGPQVTYQTEQTSEGNERVRRDAICCGHRRLVAETRVGPRSTRLRKHLACEADLDALLELPIEQDPGTIAAALAPQVARWRREAAGFPPRLGAMMNDLGEPIGPLYHLADLAELAVWSLLAPAKVEALLERLMARCRVIYRYLLEQDVGEVLFLVGSELASPPLVSRATFQRWIVPYARELIALAHSYGKRVIQHYHGQIREVLPDFLEMGPDALHTIEAPPIGNCTLAEAFEVVGDRIGLIGNIQYDDFRALTPEQMDAAVRQCLEECRGRRLMLSPTAGPYEVQISPRVQANYVQFVHSGWQHGRVAEDQP